MSETFDPDSWPHESGPRRAANPNGKPPRDNNEVPPAPADDDYDPLAFDGDAPSNPTPPTNGNNPFSAPAPLPPGPSNANDWDWGGGTSSPEPPRPNDDFMPPTSPAAPSSPPQPGDWPVGGSAFNGSSSVFGTSGAPASPAGAFEVSGNPNVAIGQPGISQPGMPDPHNPPFSHNPPPSIPTSGFDGGGNDFANLYDDPSAPPQGQQPYFEDDDWDDMGATTPSHSDYQSYDDVNFGADRNNGYQDEEGWDQPEKATRSKGGRILPIVAVILFVAIVGVGAKTVLGGHKAKHNTAATQVTTDQSTVSSAGGVGTVQQAPQEVTDALNNALTAWGKFAVSGDINLVTPYFTSDGPQMQRFQTDAASIQQSAVGGDPMVFTIQAPQTVKITDNEWLFRGPVTATRTNSGVQNFNWEIRVIRSDAKSPWQVLSVIDTSAKASQ